MSVHFELFQDARLNVRNILLIAKRQYFNNKTKECKGNKTTIFDAVNKVLHLNQTVVLKIIKCDKGIAYLLIIFSIQG